LFLFYFLWVGVGFGGQWLAFDLGFWQCDAGF
jgi:hypothetical protein